jgi:hypothetical protein
MSITEQAISKLRATERVIGRGHVFHSSEWPTLLAHVARVGISWTWPSTLDGYGGFDDPQEEAPPQQDMFCDGPWNSVWIVNLRLQRMNNGDATMEGALAHARRIGAVDLHRLTPLQVKEMEF